MAFSVLQKPPQSLMVRGPITTEWRRIDEKLALDLAIPPNTTATVFLPAHSPDQVNESGVVAARSPGVKFLRLENGNAVFEIASGKYQFTVASLLR